MLHTKRIKVRFGDDICRTCINKTYGVRLRQEDCRYGYVYACPCCGQFKNIVVGFETMGKLKMLLRF